MSGNAREKDADREVALTEDLEDASKRLAAISLAKFVATGASTASIDRKVFLKELLNEWGLPYEGIFPTEPRSTLNTSTGSVGARSYVTIDERIHQDEYRDTIYILVKGAMATEDCTWESVDGSAWNSTLTSHESLSDWIGLFNAGLPRGEEASYDDRKRIKVLHQGGQTMGLSKQYFTSHRDDPHKLLDLLEKQQRALQTDHHSEWPQHKLIRIIGQCRNLTGAVDSDDGDARWYVIGLGDVFCPGGDRCRCPTGMIKIKAETVENRWYDKTVHETPAGDCSAGGEGEGGSEQAATQQATRATKQREDNLPYLQRVDVSYDGRPPPGVINCDREFLWPVELIEYDFEGVQNLKNGTARYTSARGRKTGGPTDTSGEGRGAGRGGRGGGSGRCGKGRGRGRGRANATAEETIMHGTNPDVDMNVEEDVGGEQETSELEGRDATGGEKRRRTTRGTQQQDWSCLLEDDVDAN